MISFFFLFTCVAKNNFQHFYCRICTQAEEKGSRDVKLFDVPMKLMTKIEISEQSCVKTNDKIVSGSNSSKPIHDQRKGQAVEKVVATLSKQGKKVPVTLNYRMQSPSSVK